MLSIVSNPVVTFMLTNRYTSRDRLNDLQAALRSDKDLVEWTKALALARVQKQTRTVKQLEKDISLLVKSFELAYGFDSDE